MSALSRLYEFLLNSQGLIQFVNFPVVSRDNF